jgi:hypothetical protein
LTRVHRAWLLAAALVAGSASSVQGQAPEEAPAGRPAAPEWAVGLRLGAFEMTNSSESWDAVFGGPMPQLGGQLEVRVWQRFMVAIAADWGEASGRRILPTRPPIRTDVGTTLSHLPAHLTLGWFPIAQRPWELFVGAGPSLLSWRESSLGNSRSDTTTGGHAVLGGRRHLRRFTLGGEVRWSTFPDAAGDRAAMAFFDEDDMGGFSVHFVALHRLGR